LAYPIHISGTEVQLKGDNRLSFPPNTAKAKEVNVDDYANAAALVRFLKELDFPTNKDKIIPLVRLKIPINLSQNERKKIY